MAPASAPAAYTVDIKFATGAAITSARVLVREGRSFSSASGSGQARLSAAFTVTAVAPDSVRLRGKVSCAGAVARPTLVTRLGDPASVGLDGAAGKHCELTLTVRPQVAATVVD